MQLLKMPRFHARGVKKEYIVKSQMSENEESFKGSKERSSQEGLGLGVVIKEDFLEE